MLHCTYPLAGAECDIYFPESREDLDGFNAFLSRGERRPIGYDTESTGLDLFTPGHRLRLAQFGDEREAWVLRADMFGAEIGATLHSGRPLVAHNAPYDAMAAQVHLGVDAVELLGHVSDTRIWAHLLDPRDERDGGIGLELKSLAVRDIDPRANEPARALLAEFRRHKLTKTTGFAQIPVDNEAYRRYAGMDPILTAREAALLRTRVGRAGLDSLSTFEHGLQSVLTILMCRGLRVDVPYATALAADLTAEAQQHKAHALERYGVENVNSGTQVADALIMCGESLSARTPTGKFSVDAATLLPLADLDKDFERVGLREPNGLADAVVRAKRAEKWCVAYARAFLGLRDGHDRIHPTIGGLAARTGRMSVSTPPLQQLPATDWRIRRAILPDVGYVMIAADYAQVEMRVIAALAGERAMIEAISRGVDIHDFAAMRMFGSGFTKAQRKLAKRVGFAKVYGGGVVNLARDTGLPLAVVRAAIDAYDQAFPGIARYSRALERSARSSGMEVVTPWGRRLPLDASRSYAATNYMVQSSARDLLAAATVRAYNAGLIDYVLLLIHDEILGQALPQDAQEVVEELGRIMATEFYGLPIEVDTQVYGSSWGAGYGAPEEVVCASIA